MRKRRQNRGFEQAAKVPLDRTVLPAARAREMRLNRDWPRVAGAAIASRARVLRVARGILEIELLTTDPGWVRTLSEVVPQAASRLAADEPDLGIRKLRLRVPGEPNPPAVDLPQATLRRPDDERPRARSEAEAVETEAPDPAEVMRRYLERVESNQKP